MTINAVLGFGYDGYVVGTSEGTVLKSFKYPELYRKELAIYRYMDERQIGFLSGFRIPQLIEFDDDLSLIVITWLQPPFVVDFASATIGAPAFEFDEETMAAWNRQKRDEFGDDWPSVKRLLFALQSRNIYLRDVHPRNIMCR